jgi:hypothetical protein
MSNEPKKPFAALLVAGLMAGCATAPPEVTMDWPSFVKSVPGTDVWLSDDYKTTTLKRSLSPAGSAGLDQVKAQFQRWCTGQRGKASSSPLGNAVAMSFEGASSAWGRQSFMRLGERYNKTTVYCVDTATNGLTAVLLIDAYAGSRGGLYQPDQWPAPVMAFYTPSQAAEFAQHYNDKEVARAKEVELESERRHARQVEETRRLRTQPRIGDVTLEGTIVDIRPPLVLMQYNASQRNFFGKPQSEWVPMSALNAVR